MPTSPHAAGLLTFPDLVFTDGLPRPWRTLFQSRIGPSYNHRLILEIGCASATLLTTIAPLHPTTSFLGLDSTYRALHQAAQRIQSADHKNLALLRASAQHIPRLFTPGDLDEIWIFHPDPHYPLLTESFLHAAHTLLRPSGSLILKTDNPAYYHATLSLTTPFKTIISSPNFWHDPQAQSISQSHPFANHTTPYESRFLKKKLPIHYLELRAQH
ncbi:MAG TPA: methyltransferase [Tepidisphaeraceae bacterium]|nr:methyltransferase [Tepidisphaeraceae bacterium]